MALVLTDDAAITALLPVKEYDPRFLREAIGSVFSQTSADWRLLVVLDPAAAELADRAILTDALKDPRVGVTPNRGRKLAGSFNTGMRVSQTEFVAILLGDDLWAPEAVEVGPPAAGCVRCNLETGTNPGEGQDPKAGQPHAPNR